MKTTYSWVTILLFLLLPMLSIAQTNGKVIYKVILESEEFKELEGTLLFDGQESLFFVDMQSQHSSRNQNEQIEFENDNKVNFHFDFSLNRPLQYEVFIDREKGTIYNQRSFFKDSKTKPCVVFEETGLIEWKFEDGIKKIGSFSAHKATAYFRGRKYEAWFTPEIPIGLGPWKFHGLPGIILEIKDEELGVQFLFSSIQIPFENKDSIKLPVEGDLISLNEFINYRNNFNSEFIRLVKAKLRRDVSISDISIKENDRSIEREYD